MNLCRWTAVAGMVVAIGGCVDATAPISNSQIGANHVRLTVSASASEVTRGSPVNLHVTLVNEGTQAVTLHFGDSCQINPYIRNLAGEIVLPGGGAWGCLTVLTSLTLAPQGSVSRDYVWRGSTDFASEMPLRPLPAGRYFFSAKVPAGEMTLSAGVGITLK
jgi:hypothetical protein